MLVRKIVFVTLALVAINQTSSQACCMTLLLYDIQATVNNLSIDPSVIVSITNVSDSFSPFKDTLYSSEFMSDLMAKFNSSQIVVLTSVTETNRFFPEIEKPDESVGLKEFATIRIQRILKGTVQQYQKTVINTIFGESQILKYDSLTGKMVKLIRKASIEDAGYRAIQGKTFLLFADNEEQCFNLPFLGPCDFSTNCYQVTNVNELSFDGLTVDLKAKKVVNHPDVKINFDQFITNIQPLSVVNESYKLSYNRSTNSAITVYDLLGKKLPVYNQNLHELSRSPAIHLLSLPGESNSVRRILSVNKR